MMKVLQSSYGRKGRCLRVREGAARSKNHQWLHDHACSPMLSHVRESQRHFVGSHSAQVEGPYPPALQHSLPSRRSP
jgi:hypothetical protein